MHNGIFRNTRHTNPQADLRNSTDEVRFFISCRKDSRLEKPLNFDPFGHARFAHLFVLYD